MIISVSIVDYRRERGRRHVGTYTFEVDHPDPEREGQIDLHAVASIGARTEEQMRILRPQLGKLCTLAGMIAAGDTPIRESDGVAVDANGKPL